MPEDGTPDEFCDAVPSQCRQATGGRPTTYLAAGLLDELQIHVAPVLLGGGVRLFDDSLPAPVELEAERVVASPGVTHLRFRVAR